MSKILDKIKKLYALTKNPNEEEARTAAYLCIKLARENGITVIFRENAEAAPTPSTPAATRNPYERAQKVETTDDLSEEFFRGATNFRWKAERHEDHDARPWVHPPNTQPGEPSILTRAKYTGLCRTCKGHFNVGDPMWWRPNKGMVHKACGPAFPGDR